MLKMFLVGATDVAAPGKVALVARGPVERLWLDSRPLAPAEKVTLDAAAGVHLLTLLLGEKSSDDLRIELADVPDSQAQAQFVGGK